MADINTFVLEFQSRLVGLNIVDFVAKWNTHSIIGAVISVFSLDDMCAYLEDVFGQQPILDFFQGCERKADRPGKYLGMLLANEITRVCNVEKGGAITLNVEHLLAILTELQAGIVSGKVDYTITIHLTNIDIPESFTLLDGKIFEKLPPEQVYRQFRFNMEFFPPPSSVNTHWGAHGVVVRMNGRATPAEIEQMSRIDEQGALENSITGTFYISGVLLKTFPQVTHVNFDSVLGRDSHLNGYGPNFQYQPTMLSQADISRIKVAYSTVSEAKMDRVLAAAIDRFILGKKRDLHHPNRINHPNWDKLVDYIIAFETLFLSSKGGSVGQELSYRLRVNGTLVLSNCLALKSRTIFDALKHLYDLRSAVVHGGDDKKVLKAANGFLSLLDKDSPNHKHSIGRILLVSTIVEDWLTIVFDHLGKMPMSERPYQKTNGWDELLWPGPVGAVENVADDSTDIGTMPE